MLETSLKMPDHQYLFNIYFAVIIVCILHLSSPTTINFGRQRRSIEGGICQESQTTLKKVTDCPENDYTFNERSNKKKCDSYPTCAGKPLVYHCVRSGDSLVEVCAPRTLITGWCCPFYYEKLGRVVEDFNRLCSMCPFQYQSDDCVNKTECTEPGNNEATMIITTETLHEIFEDDNTNNTQDMTENKDPTFLTIIVVAVIVFLCFCLAITCHYRYRLTTFCFKVKREDVLQNHKNTQGSLKLPCKDLTYRESSEAMIIDGECTLF